MNWSIDRNGMCLAILSRIYKDWIKDYYICRDKGFPIFQNF